MTYGYVYKTTNLITNKIYIGKKKSHKKCEAYYGSGIVLKHSLKKYGKINHINEILVWADNNEQLNMLEKFWIKTYNSTNSEIGYNITTGGDGGKGGWNKGIPCREETKKKLSEGKMGNIPWNKGISWDDDMKLKLSKSHKGQIAWNIGIRMPEEQKERQSQKMKGRKLTEEHKQKIRDNHKTKNK